MSLDFDGNFGESQARWMSFLSNMERSLPGIKGTARPLLASLTFGLQRLVKAAKLPEGFIHYQASIEALTKYLIQRMANARASILFSAEEARRLSDKRRILERLTDGSLDTRSTYRLLHLSADYAKDLLVELVDDRCLRRRDEKWERIEGATLPKNPNGLLALEI